MVIRKTPKIVQIRIGDDAECKILRDFAKKCGGLEKGRKISHFFALFWGVLEKCAKVRIFLHSFAKLNFFAVKRRVFLQKNRRDLT